MTEKWKTKLAENINKQLAKRKMTQKELSIRAGMTEASVSRYIHLTRTPNISAIYRLSLGLGCRVQDLLKGIKVEEMIWLMQIKI